MHVFKGEHGHRMTGVPSCKLWRALHEVDRYLSSQSSWLVDYAKRYRAGLRVGTSITEGTANFLVNRRMNKSHMWTAPSSQGILQCFDQIACVHMSGLLVRSHMNAGQDGFRDKGSKQQSDL
jgi:phage-related protein